MTYGNIYELMKFLKEKKIKLSKGVLEKVLESQLKPKYFEILKESEEIIELFLYPFPTDNKYDFIMQMKSKVSFEELKSLVQMFNWKKITMCYREFIRSCENPNILADKEILNLIASRDDHWKMEQIRLACENSSILRDKVALRFIAKQDTIEKMREVHLACENPNIFADKEILRLIASRDSFEKMSEVRLACENPNILNDKEILNLIASQEKQ